MSATRRLAGAVLALAIGALALSSPSASARGLTTGFYEPSYLSPDAKVRDTWFSRTVQENARIVRIGVNWSSVAGSNPPANPTNPADPDYDFSRIDAAVKSARAHHLQVMLTLQSAPTWAEGPDRPRRADPGTWKPNARDFGRFAEAVARRYSGSFDGLPRVRFFQAWSEQNLAIWLAPVWNGKKPAAPDRYRQMLNAFYAGVKRAQPGAKVVSGGLAPYGDPPGGDRMRPLVFLKHLFCLNNKLKPTCRAKPHFDILAEHPINLAAGPLKHAPHPGDVAVPDMPEVRQVLRAAERAGHVRPAGRHPLWVTELFWSTHRGSPFAVRPLMQARWIEQAFYKLWTAGVSVVMNFEIRDEKFHPHAPTSTIQSGTFFYDGRKKPSFRSFRFPLVTHRRSKRAVGVWGKAPRGGELLIQGRRGGGWRTMKRLHVRRGQVFNIPLRPHGARAVRGKVGGLTSLAWPLGR